MKRATIALFAAALIVTSAASATLIESTFVRGDVNRDMNVDISDPLCMLRYLFAGEDRVDELCLAAADANADDRFDISDPVYTLCFLFCGGPMIPAPFPSPGVDPEPGELSCQEYAPTPSTE